MKSMTGYGKGVAAHDGRELTVELKSVNHRFLDIGMRVPRTLSCTEDTIRKVLSERLSRGHIDVFLNYRNTRTDAKTVRVDTQLLAAYVAAARSIPQSLDLPDDLTLTGALRLPDVTEIVTADEDAEALTALAKQATNAAVDALETMRHAEGERLKAALSAEVDQMAAYREQILARAPMVTEDYRKKLTERIEQVLSDAEIDRARLATEIALFAQSHEEYLRKYISLECGVPSHDTIQRVMAMIAPEVIQQLQQKWQELLNRDEGEKLRKIVAIDGKTMRGNTQNETGAIAV